MNIFKLLFRKKLIKAQEPDKEANIGNIAIYDDIWVKINDEIFDGWVLGKVGNKVSIVYDDKIEHYNYADFIIERPLNRTEITQNNKTLIVKR